MIVAPSLLIVTFRPSKTNLSIPRGPRVVRTASATAWQALIFEISWGLPCHCTRIGEVFVRAREVHQKYILYQYSRFCSFRLQPKLTCDVSVPSRSKIMPGRIPKAFIPADDMVSLSRSKKDLWRFDFPFGFLGGALGGIGNLRMKRILKFWIPYLQF